MKDFILTYDLHLFTILLLFFIIWVSKMKSDSQDYKNQLLISIFLLSILLLSLEILSYSFDGLNTTFARVCNYIFNGSLLVVTPVLISHIACYIDYSIFDSMERLKKRWYYTQPFIIVLILVIINLFVPTLYEITQENIFIKGPFHISVLISLFLLYLYIMVEIVSNRAFIKSKIIVGSVLFFIFPVAIETLDVFYGDLPFTYIAVSYSSIFLYLLVETTSADIDSLTGLYNKARASKIIRTEIKKDNRFCVILLDMDNFKKVNDEFGHLVGDQVIIDFAKKVSLVFGKDSLVARYGGDEFIVVSNIIDRKVLVERMDRIDHLIQFNKQRYASFMGFSYGISFSDELKNLDELIIVREADRNMFAYKRKSKVLKRRSTD